MLPEIPPRCSHCLTFSLEQPQHHCQVCRDQAMSESYLCDIVRRSSAMHSFVCQAFRPNLTLVGKPEEKGNGLPSCQDKQSYFANVIQLIGAGQCADGCGRGECRSALSNGPTEKYHVVWGVHQRRALFSASNRYVAFLHDILLSCGRLMAGKVVLLWLAPDHLHLYLECASWEDENEIVEDLQGLVHDALLEQFSSLKTDYAHTMIWDREFFLEKINPD